MQPSAENLDEDTSRQQVKHEILTQLHPPELSYLHDLVHNPNSHKSAEYYLSTNVDKRLLIDEEAAEDLVNNYFESTRQFIELRETQFQEGKLSTSQIVDSLSNENYDEDFLNREEISKNYDRLLLIAYDAYYNHDKGDLSLQFKKLLARAQIMHERSEEVYQSSEHLPLDKIDEVVDEFVNRKNIEGSKAVQVWCGKADEEAWLKFFKERNRYSRFVFKFREEGTKQTPDPQVTTNSVYRVATIGVTIRNTGNSAEVELSDNPKSKGMTGLIKDFFGELGEDENLFESFEKRTIEAADSLIDTAKEVAEDEDSENEEVIGSVQEEMDNIVKSNLEILKESDDITEEEFEEMQTQVSENGGIDVAGIGVRKDENTGIDRLTVRSEAPLPEWGYDIDEFNTVTKSVLADVDRENLVLIFRIPEVDGESYNFFEVKSGTWTDHGGMSRETINNIEQLLTATDE